MDLTESPNRCYLLQSERGAPAQTASSLRWATRSNGDVPVMHALKVLFIAKIPRKGVTLFYGTSIQIGSRYEYCLHCLKTGDSCE